jgi:hypothetical protein
MSKDAIGQAIVILTRAQQMRPGTDYRAGVDLLKSVKKKGDAVKLLHAEADNLVAAGLAANRGNAIWLMANDPRYKTKYKAIVEAAAAQNPAAAEGVRPVKPIEKGETYRQYVKTVQASTGALKTAAPSAVERDRLAKAASGGDASAYQQYVKAFRANI